MTPMKPLYIFDLDGTLALIEHRRHIVQEPGRDDTKWRRFYAACDKDEPNLPVMATLEHLRHSGAEVWIFSGRSDEVRDKTVAWLAQHTSFMSWELDTALTMRAQGDYTADDVLKRQWFNGMLVDDRLRLVAVFDDRDRVVAMWRDAGVTCFQVAHMETSKGEAMTTSAGPCTFKRGPNWDCGSYAFNLRRDGIDQGTLCDVHYWQTEAERLRDSQLCDEVRQLHLELAEERRRTFIAARIAYRGYSYRLDSQDGVDDLRRAINERGDF